MVRITVDAEMHITVPGSEEKIGMPEACRIVLGVEQEMNSAQFVELDNKTKAGVRMHFTGFRLA